MAFTEEDKAKMDAAAVDAELDTELVADDAMTDVARWWKKWYPKAGHKRLARILLQYAPKENQQ